MSFDVDITGMKRYVLHLLLALPFFVAFAVDSNKMRVSLNTARIIEGIIIAIISGLLAGTLASYIAGAKMEIELSNMKINQARLEQKIDSIESRLFDVLKEVRK